MVVAALTLTACLATASPLAAQTPAGTDSILARLERAEEQIALLRQQLAAQATSGVQSRSGARVELWGRVMMNAWRNNRLVNSVDVPTLALAGPYPPFASTAGAAFRQTVLGLDLSNVQALGAQLRASVSADFSGGVQTGSGNRRLFPEPRLRIAKAALHWNVAEIMVGQDVPLITPEDPVSLASVGTPGFAAAGNLWFWLPQFRLTLETPTRVRLGIQGAIMAPWSNEDPSISGNVDPGELSDRPFFQGRLRAAWGDAANPGEIGVGAHVGWIRRTASTTREQGHAFAGSARIPIGWLELRGEGYVGKLLRGLGGGGIGQNFGRPPVPGADGLVLRDNGGWGQLNLRPRSSFMIGGGCGIDDPTDDDLPIRSRNQVCGGHMQIRPAGPIVIALEMRGLQTTYLPSRETARSSHVNVAMGVEF